jgi:hypothetical protein
MALSFNGLTVINLDAVDDIERMRVAGAGQSAARSLGVLVVLPILTRSRKARFFSM